MDILLGTVFVLTYIGILIWLQLSYRGEYLVDARSLGTVGSDVKEPNKLHAVVFYDDNTNTRISDANGESSGDASDASDGGDFGGDGGFEFF